MFMWDLVARLRCRSRVSSRFLDGVSVSRRGAKHGHRSR